MGWSSGSDLMDSVIFALKPVKDAAVRRGVYAVLIPAFEDMDCDTLYECRGEDKAFDAALDNANPDERTLSFCITGRLSGERDAWIVLIEDAGHEYRKTVSAGLTYLVMAAPNLRTAKSDKAHELGVTCIGEDELRRILEEGP